MKRISLLLCVGLGFAFLVSSIDKPLQADSIPFAKYVERSGHEELYLWHPPLYQNTLRFVSRLFNLQQKELRWFGVGCFLLTLALVYLLGKEVARQQGLNGNVGLLAVSLYALHPLAIQGSLILDIDNTVLSVLLTAFVYCFARTYPNLSLRRSLLLGILFFVLLWAKLSTPFLLILAMFVFLWLGQGLKAALTKTSVIAITAIALFLVTWFGYARINSLPFPRVFLRVGLFCLPGSIEELLKRVIRLTLWLNPYLLTLGIFAFVQRLKHLIQTRELKILDFGLLYVAVIFAGYVVVGGLSFYFPKYHFPLLPILVIVAAEFIFGFGFRFSRRHIFFGCALTLALVFYNIIVVGDLHYLLNYTLRITAIFNPEKIPQVSGLILGKLILFFLPFILITIIIRLVLRYNFLKTTALSLLIACLSSNLALNIIQARSAYCTNYCYGRDIQQMRKLKQLFRELKSQFNGGIFIGPEDILVDADILSYQQVKVELLQYQYHLIGNNREKFIRAISDPKVVCVTFSPFWNSLIAYRELCFDDSVQNILKSRFQPRQIGLAQVWVKRKK